MKSLRTKNILTTIKKKEKSERAIIPYSIQLKTERAHAREN